MHRNARFTRFAVLGSIAVAFTALVAWNTANIPVASAHYHDTHPVAPRGGGAGLPSGSNDWFRGSGTCEGCHGHDPAALAGVDEDGNDVNLVDDWRSTMMANSARDPFWQAKVSHEVLVNPGHQAELEDKCTSCHAPQGRHNKHLLGLGPYSMAELVVDDVALDGVACVACHRLGTDSLGDLFSGNLKFTEGDTLWGPYWDNIFGAPMTAFVGFRPAYSAHINSAGLCAGCHTLITETADLAGNATGDHFVEQATYHEWLNSAFNNEVDTVNGISCQGCHVPRIDDPVVLSANYTFLTGRSPFGLHQFAGGNSFMLNLLRDNIQELNLTADSVQFDSTIARTLRNLQHHSVLLDVSVAARTADTAFIDVDLTNLTGHKFPSGYPSRRAWIQLSVVNASTGDTLFSSGAFDTNDEVVGHPTDFWPHFDAIDSELEAQVYEMVMGDVNDDKTTVLERAKTKLKDNRLVPPGFSITHSTYDTAYIAGVPASDIDFNHDALGVEGDGGDVTHYHVPMSGFTGMIGITARVWYQAAPPLWNQELFSYAGSSAAIDSFITMYNDADNTPVLVKEKSIVDMSVGIDAFEELGISVHPNPSTDGWLNVTGLDARVLSIEVFDATGRSVARTGKPNGPIWRLRLPASGTYLVAFRTVGGSFTRRVVSR